MTTRIYRVFNSRTGAEHLVRASSQAQAIRHVVADEYHAVVAGQETIVELMSAGVRVRDATADATADVAEAVEEVQ